MIQAKYIITVLTINQTNLNKFTQSVHTDKRAYKLIKTNETVKELTFCSIDRLNIEWESNDRILDVTGWILQAYDNVRKIGCIRQGQEYLGSLL